MDRSLDEIISERPRGHPSRPDRRPPPQQAPPPPRAPRREEYPRDGVRKNRRDDRVKFNSDWVHDRYDGEDVHERSNQRLPDRERYVPGRNDGPDGAKIRVDNLHYDLTEDDLRDLFTRVGPVHSIELLYDRMDRSRGTAFIVYKDPLDARDAIAQFDGQNAYGQPIRLTLAPSAPASRGGSSLFDRVERPSRSLFDRIEGGPENTEDSREDVGRRRHRSDSPYRRPPPADVDRYVPGGRRSSRSPIRRRGTPRESGRRPGQRRENDRRPASDRRPRTDEEGHRIVGGRPKKTAEELDAEMADYWGSKANETATNGAAAPSNGTTGSGDAATVGNDVDMIE